PHHHQRRPRQTRRHRHLRLPPRRRPVPRRLSPRPPPRRSDGPHAPPIRRIGHRAGLHPRRLRPRPSAHLPRKILRHLHHPHLRLRLPSRGRREADRREKRHLPPQPHHRPLRPRRLARRHP